MGKKQDVLTSRGIEKTFSSILAIFIALILTGIFIWAIGFNPLEAYSVLIQGAFKGKAALSETVVCAIPLIFSSLAFAVAYQCGIFISEPAASCIWGLFLPPLLVLSRGCHQPCSLCSPWPRVFWRRALGACRCRA